MLKKIINRIKPQSKEELSAFLMYDLFHGKPYLPYTNSSLFLHSILCIINDMIVNKKRSIIEFGCGISTVIIARAIRQNKVPAKIVSIEESEDWINVVKDYLDKEQLSDFVTFIHAPLKKAIDIEAAFTYDSSLVKKEIQGKTFDLVLIDGPSAWRKDTINSRAANLELFKDCLSNEFSIFIDNADRPGEQLLTRRIQAALQIKPTKITNSFYVFTQGKHFNFIL
jgi:predicted O-methyltransferase YrrM